jgi:hypothetical protein
MRILICNTLAACHTHSNIIRLKTRRNSTLHSLLTSFRRESTRLEGGSIPCLSLQRSSSILRRGRISLSLVWCSQREFSLEPSIDKGPGVTLLLYSDGKKMSKSLKNYPDPTLIVNQYGADAMRFVLVVTSRTKHKITAMPPECI